VKLHTKILIGMGVGLLLGLLFGPNSALLPQDGVELPAGAVMRAVEGPEPEPMAAQLKAARIVQEERRGGNTWLRVEASLDAPALVKLKKAGVAEAASAREGHRVQGWVKQTEKVRRFASLGQALVDATEWIGKLFLALIKMVVAPLVFFSLVVGVASLGDLRALGRVGGRTLAWFTGTTVAALVIGVGLANLVRPGAFLSAADKAMLLRSYQGAASGAAAKAADAPALSDQLLALIPTNPFAALASGDMLQIITFAALLGVALTFLKDKRGELVVEVFDRLNDAMIMLVHVAMKLAPFGVAALLLKVAGTTGASVLVALAAYAAVVAVGLLLHLVIVYGLAVRLGARLPFLGFLGALKEPMLVAFSTSSSSATLPVTKEACEQNLHISPQITSFVLPLGATVNMDGTALYQGVAALFIAQLYDLDLTLGDQATIIFSATLASVGAAGVPGAGLITLTMVLTAVGVPTEGLALILGVDRLLDMLRTTINVVGDAAAAALMGRLEGNPLRLLSDAEDAADPTRGFEGRLDAGPQPLPPAHDR
jgi:Na+/H+-dicarboxylate symporter